jgi:hypothetical protein
LANAKKYVWQMPKKYKRMSAAAEAKKLKRKNKKQKQVSSLQDFYDKNKSLMR